jgi:hypothetical protein
VRTMVEEEGFHACEKLSSCEKVVGEVISPGESPVLATEISKFLSSLLLNP